MMLKLLATVVGCVGEAWTDCGWHRRIDRLLHLLDRGPHMIERAVVERARSAFYGDRPADNALGILSRQLVYLLLRERRTSHEKTTLYAWESTNSRASRW